MCINFNGYHSGGSTFVNVNHFHSFSYNLITSVVIWFLAAVLSSGRDINYSRDLIGLVIFKN